MICIVTALHAEAQPIIENYHLKKSCEVSAFEYFCGDALELIVCGVGKVRAAAATSFILKDRAHDGRLLALNIGVCGAKKDYPIGSLFLCNKLTDYSAGRSFYPDILFKHNLREAALHTFDRPLCGEPPGEAIELADMEGSAFFQAASLFLGPHQIFSLKAVSDHFEISEIEIALVTELIRQRLPEIEEVMQNALSALPEEQPVFRADEEAVLHSLAQRLHLSAMQNRLLRRSAAGYLRSGGNLSLLAPFESLRPASRQEGRQILAQIQALLSGRAE